MTRGRPALWSSLLGLPFVVVAGYIVLFQETYPLVANQPTAPASAGIALGVFGLFVVGLGVYVQFAATPGKPRMRENERVVDSRTPAQRSALAKAVASVPVLVAGLYVLYFTEHPLVYPAVALAVGLYLFSTGLYRYWRNTLTNYLLTNRRMIQEYRFISLVRTEIPLEKVRAVEERRSAWESLFGLGNVRVRAGATSGLTVAIQSVYDSTEFADVIRDRIGRVDEDDRGRVDHADSTGVASKTDDEVPSGAGDEELSGARDEEPVGGSDEESFAGGGTHTDERSLERPAELTGPRSDGGTVDASAGSTDEPAGR